MKIVCISDTHVHSTFERLPAALYDAVKDADLILHAGDIVILELIEGLKAFAPVEAVAGNMDDWEVAKVLPAKKVIQAGRFSIGLIHGGG
ncbi:MAG TPA: metallophosphoesterase family protein, partial [Nitrospirota bacterium]|nr:metallophosphoesterase family protein [Nitrospirota bacterium]